MGYGDVGRAVAEVAPVTGEVLSGKRAWDNMNNLPNPMDYVKGDTLDYQGFMDANQSHGGEIGLDLMGAAPGAGLLVQGARKLPGAIGRDMLRPNMVNQEGMITWHGSPHKFDEFDEAYKGTGEGNQAFGDGAAYLAEAKGVGTGYVGQGMVSPRLKMVIDDNGGDIRKAIQSLEANDPHNLLNEAKAADGYLYEVDLPDDKIAQMLDLDAPVDFESPFGQKIFNAAEESGLDSDDLREIMAAPGSGYEGQPESGKSIYDWLSSSLGGDQKASAWLNTEGIPGIKYFDGNSRAGAEGTRNFIPFDAKDTTILSRNGEKIAK